MSGLNKQRIAMCGVALCIVLAYPMWQVGEWLAKSIWTGTQEAVTEQAKHMTLVVGGVLKINIDGMSMTAVGTDRCPGQESPTMRRVFGEPADAGKQECIVVSPSTEKVQVTLASREGHMRTEQWLVERDAGRVSFRRPNGLPVSVSSN